MGHSNFCDVVRQEPLGCGITFERERRTLGGPNGPIENLQGWPKTCKVGWKMYPAGFTNRSPLKVAGKMRNSSSNRWDMLVFLESTLF